MSLVSAWRGPGGNVNVIVRAQCGRNKDAVRTKYSPSIHTGFNEDNCHN